MRATPTTSNCVVKVDPSTQLLIDILVQDILTCDLCSKRMCLSPLSCLPKNLDCTHTFCVNCLEGLKTGMGMFSSIICPQCKVETTLGISGVMGLKNNHTVISVINILEAFNAVNCSICHVKPATLQCHTCLEPPNLCESCHTAEDSIHTYHDVRPLDLHSILHTNGQVRVKSSDDEEIVVQCPRNIVGRVLSSPRNSFEKIRSDTQCSVDVRKLSDRESPAHITIRGPRQSVKIAQSMVEDIMESVVVQNRNELENVVDTEELDQNEYTLDITYYEAIDIFEIRYNSLQRIATQTNTDIVLLPNGHDDRMRSVIIRPCPGAIQCRTGLARKLILKMTEEITDMDREKRTRRPSLAEPSGEVSDVVVLTTLQYHKLSSSGFAPLQRIAQRVGCRIDANEDKQTGIVIIKGSIIQVREAKQLLKHVLDNRPHTFTSTTVPPGFSALPNHPNMTPPRNFVHDSSSIYGTPTSFSGHDDRRRPQSFTHLPPVSPSNALHGGTISHFTFKEPHVAVAHLSCEYESIGKLVGARGGRLEELRRLTDCKIVVKRGDSNESCAIEIIGAPDRVAYAVPMIKMVLGSGDAVMTTVRSILPPACEIDRHTLPPTHAAPISRRLPLSPKQSQNTLLHRHSEESENSSHSEDCQGESKKLPASETSQVLEPPTSLETDDYVSDDDNEDQKISSPSLQSKTALAAHKYNISPPPTPPPSSLFPEYFIQSRNPKLTEVVPYPHGNLPVARLQDIALFTRCKITYIEKPTQHSSRFSLQLQGQADQRELAKLLIDAAIKPNLYRSPGISQKDGLDGVVRTMDCPPHFIPVLIGPGGATIESIQTQSCTKILINENDDLDRPPTLSIIGTSSGVDEAVKILDRLVMNHRFKFRQNKPVLSESSRARSLPIMPRTGESVLLPSDNEEEEDEDEEEVEEGGRTLMTPSPIPLNHSMGVLSMMSNQKRQGPPRNTQSQNQSTLRQNSISQLSTISDISSLDLSRSSSNVSIGTPNWSPQSSPIRTAPSADSHGKALNLVSPRDLSQYTFESVIYCPMDKVAQVIGKRGSILRELKRLSNCEIIVNQDPPPGSVSPTPSKSSKGKRSPPPTPSTPQSKMVDLPPQPIKIHGSTQQDIDRAKELILAVIELGPVAALGMETIKMDCPADKVPLVIGIKGMTAKEMMRRTGCKIHVNEIAPEGSTMCSIELTGTSEQIEQATKIITHVLEYGTKALGKRFQRTFQKGDGEMTPSDSLDETSI